MTDIAGAVPVIAVDKVQAVALAVCTYYFGVWLKGKVGVLSRYSIPSPVVGGMSFAIVVSFLEYFNIVKVHIDSTLQTVLMLGFFTTRIGNRAILSGMYAALLFSFYNILNYFKLLPEPLQWNIHIYMAGPVCNGVMLAVALAYSLFRPEPVTEQLRGLTVWTLDSPGKAD